jgi:hypothetical protein
MMEIAKPSFDLPLVACVWLLGAWFGLIGAQGVETHYRIESPVKSKSIGLVCVVTGVSDYETKY